MIVLDINLGIQIDSTPFINFISAEMSGCHRGVHGAFQYEVYFRMPSPSTFAFVLFVFCSHSAPLPCADADVLCSYSVFCLYIFQDETINT